MSRMKPFTKGVVLLGGIAIPSLLAAAFLFGCCILPFHRQLDHFVPFCHLAADVLEGGHHDAADGHGGHDQPVTPAPQKGKASASSAAVAASEHRIVETPSVIAVLVAASLASFRSFITLGAARCDADIGLQILLTTFRI